MKILHFGIFTLLFMFLSTIASAKKTTLIEGVNVFEGTLLPKEKAIETKGDFTFKVGIQTAGHNYGSAKGFGKSNDLSFDFSRSSDVNIEASYMRNAFGAYAKYRTDVEDPLLSINSKEIFDDKSGSDNFNLGGFYMYKDQAGVFFETEVNNTGAELIPKIDIAYKDTNLNKNTNVNFNISTKTSKIGISNFASKRRSASYNELTVGLIKDSIKLPIYDSSTKEISDSEYDGLGAFFHLNVGLKAKSLGIGTPKFSLLSNSAIFSFSRGKISLPDGDETVNRISIETENEFYLNKNATFSYVYGNHGLVENNGWSDFSVVVLGAASGAIAYALVKEKESITYSGLNDIVPFKTAAGQIVVSAIGGLIMQVITEKLFDYEDKAYLNDTFYGVRLNYEF